jgi:amino acid transporter
VARLRGGADRGAAYRAVLRLARLALSAGAAYVTERAFGLPLLSFLVGLALVCSGLTSVATQSRVFAANLAVLLNLESIPLWWLALGFLLVLAGIVFRGIRESMWVNVLCTLVEASGLILVVAVGLSYWGSVDYLEMPAAAAEQGEGLILVQGAVLTFFAFIGFEDTFNVAEECRDPKRTIPVGLVLAMSMAAVLYIACRGLSLPRRPGPSPKSCAGRRRSFRPWCSPSSRCSPWPTPRSSITSRRLA